MVLNKFKTSLNFKFDYILPNDVKESVNAYITKNNNTWLIEKLRGGGKYNSENTDVDGMHGGGLCSRIQAVMGHTNCHNAPGG